MRIMVTSLFIMLLLSGFNSFEVPDEFPKTSVKFKTSDTVLQNVFNRAEKMARENIIDYQGRRVMKEGAQYVSLWLETQPMAGYMYAKRDLEIARNNIEIFIDYQRPDGRLPGVIYNRSGKIEPNYCQFQGFYFPMPSYELYFLLCRDKDFLVKVYNALEKFDSYLWKTRDSDNNGCLESWCMFDTGEDNNVRFNGFPNAWSYEFPPSKEFAVKLSADELRINCKENEYDSTAEMVVPIESMDIMSFSYSCRDVLSLISKELENGKEQYWKNNAQEVKGRIKDYLWDENKHACFDRDRNNETLPTLLHNNLRCMYFGSFDQEMADSFVKYHLLNPSEFWTPMPLPSIAANDPMFRNIQGNNWSGQPQGLTYQRSIQALENYGHYAELTLIGKKFLKVIGDSLKFTQQFDPFRATINNSRDGYGPSILSALEFISRLYGIHISQDKIFWSCIDSRYDYEYEQDWNGNTYRLETKGNTVKCEINGKSLFSFSKGCRIVTDLNGKLIEVTGLDNLPKQITYKYNLNAYKTRVMPNCIYRLNSTGQLNKYKSVEYSVKK